MVVELRISNRAVRGGDGAAIPAPVIPNREHNHLIPRVRWSFEPEMAFHDREFDRARRTTTISTEDAIDELVVGCVAQRAQQVQRFGDGRRTVSCVHNRIVCARQLHEIQSAKTSRLSCMKNVWS